MPLWFFSSIPCICWCFLITIELKIEINDSRKHIGWKIAAIWKFNTCHLPFKWFVISGNPLCSWKLICFYNREHYFASHSWARLLQCFFIQKYLCWTKEKSQLFTTWLAWSTGTEYLFPVTGLSVINKTVWKGIMQRESY